MEGIFSSKEHSVRFIATLLNKFNQRHKFIMLLLLNFNAYLRLLL